MVKVHILSLNNPRVEEVSNFHSLGEVVLVNLKVLRDLKFMKSSHNYDSVVNAPFQNHLLVKYFISIEFDL